MIVDVHGNPVEIELEEGDIITDVIILARVQDPEVQGSDIAVGVTEHTDYITRLGIIAYAKQLMDVPTLSITLDEGDED